MTSLAEVYEAKGTSLRQLYLGTGLFLAGAAMSVVAIVVATTSILEPMGVGLYGSREIAGVLAGLGVPAVFIGIFTVLPASLYQRATAAVGATIAIFGVLLFVQAYPEQWITATQDHATLPVAVVYFLGAITTFWALFTAVVNFKVRNDPGGTVTLQRIIERARAESSRSSSSTAPSSTGLGSVGIGGGIDRNPVESTPASDGGATGADIRTPTPSDDAEMLPNESDAVEKSNPDRYCGNCADFDYVRTDDGFQPYCGYYDELMDDMNPCEHWEPNA
jgi:hypothetical protein